MRGQEAVLTLLDAEFGRVCLEHDGGPQVVNLAGPLGAGKSALLAAWTARAGRRAVPLIDLAAADGVPALGRELRGTGVRVAAVDSADGPPAGDLARLLTSLDDGCVPVVAVASRRPLDSLPEWPGCGRIRVLTVAVAPWPDELIAELVSEIGAGPAGQDTVVRLSGGIPLIAECLSRALRGMRPPEVPAAADQAVRVLTAAGNPATRAGLVSQSLFLTGDEFIREQLFPEAVPPVRLRPLGSGDERLVGQLVRAWAQQRSLHTRNMDNLLEQWLAAAADGFRIAVRADGSPIGMTNVVPVTERTIPVLEPLTQHHTRELTQPGPERPGQYAGVFGGFYVCAAGQPAARAALLHYVLSEAIAGGHLTIATPWPDIEALVRQLGFAHQGETSHDVYACGRQAQVFTNSFAADALAPWLDQLSALARPAPRPASEQQVIGLIRHALDHLDSPAALAGNPLLTLPGVSSAAALRERLTEAIRALAASDLPVHADAGQALLHYYLKRCGGHEVTANRLHLSRATYFRRINHGLGELARQLLHRSPADPPAAVAIGLARRDHE